MACELTTGVGIGCKESSGGIKEIYIAVKDSTAAATQNVTGMVTSLTIGGSWYKYTPRVGTSNFMDKPKSNRQAGTAHYEQSVTLVLTKMEQAKRNEIILLAKANMWVIGKDQNDRYWLLGQDNGIELADSEGGTGTNLEEMNGYTLNFEGKEPEPAPEVLYAAFSGDVSATAIT